MAKNSRKSGGFSDHVGGGIITSPFRLLWFSIKLILAVMFGTPALLLLLNWAVFPTAQLNNLQSLNNSLFLELGFGWSKFWYNILSDTLYVVYFKLTYIDQTLRSHESDGIVAAYKSILVQFYDFLTLLLASIQVICAKVSLLTHFVVPLIIAYIIGGVLGLQERAIRRANIGRESSSLYHRYKYAQVWALVFGIQLYIILPVHFSTVLYFTFVLSVIGFLYRQQISLYKKYL